MQRGSELNALQQFFVYSCPNTSPVKARMIYASTRLSMVKAATRLGLAIAKTVRRHALLYFT